MAISELQARVAALAAEEAALRTAQGQKASSLEAAKFAERQRAAAAAAELAKLAELAAAARARAAEKGGELAEARRQLAVHQGIEEARRDPAWRDWNNAVGEGLPEEVLVKVAEKVVAQTEAGWAARLKEYGYSEEDIQEQMAKRKVDGNCLFVFALVGKGWRKAQLKVRGPLRARVESDVLLPGSVALAKWALAEGCPRYHSMAVTAAWYGHAELVKWLCGEGGFAMDEVLMSRAARSGNLELVQWLRGEGCPWDYWTCYWAVKQGHVEVLRWARANGCPWDAETGALAAAKLGYRELGDDFNLGLFQ